METSLLKTKLNIPPTRPQLVQRPQLYERLQEGLNHKLVLVSAPAGFGKTTLLSEWVHNSKPRISTAWISLDEGDNDPVRFWDYFIASIRTFQTDFAINIIPWLHSSQPPSTESLVIALINELVNIAGDCVIVLDDYHLIESQQIQDGISYMLEHIPAQMHLVIATRADPSLPLSRLRGKGTMLEVRTDELRFNRGETADLYNQLDIPELSAENIAILNDRTEGWVTGLKMAAFSMLEQKDIPAFIAAFTGSQRYVMDYLIEEVLQKQTDEIRDFLLKTSILERISGLLCDAITERQNSNDTLMELEQNHLFIVPLDESRNWYRYEHLFADILQHQCEMAYGKEQVITLHQKASRWYEDKGLLDNAINHALTAQDWENAARLITEHSKEKTKNGEYVTLIEWIRALPEHILQTNRLICLPYYEALIQTGQLDDAELQLRFLEKMAEDDEYIMGEVIAIKAMIASRRNERSLCLELAQKALLLLSPDSLNLRANMFFILAMTGYESDLKEAEKVLKKSRELALKAGENYIAFFALTLLGLIYIRRGNLHQATEFYQKAIDQIEPSPAAAPPHTIMSSILYEYNDLEGAEYHIQRVIELSKLTGYPERLMVAYHQLATIKLTQGDMSGALKALDMAISEAQKLKNPYSIAQHTAWRMGFAIRQGDIDTASELCSKLPKNIDDLPWMVTDYPARLLIAQGKKEEAAAQLQYVYGKAIKSEERSTAAKIRVYQSLAAENEEEAVEFLSDALTVGEEGGFIRTFVNEGKLLKPLLRKALARGITPEYIGKLITIIEAEERRRKIESGAVLLSERELEVIRLIAVGVSNQQIADKLSISINTVKTHIRHILEKLNARDRSQATYIARELALI